MNISGADKDAHRKIIIESKYNLNLLYVDDKEHLNNIFNVEVESIIKHRIKLKQNMIFNKYRFYFYNLIQL